jgi:hypothetical protein
MKMNSALSLLVVVLLFAVSLAADPPANQPPVPANEADELAQISLNSFEHFDYLDILYKLKGHNSDTWVVLFFIDEDHHKEERDRLKKLVFRENPTFKYAEANISKSNYAPIKQAIRFPQNATARDYPMVLIMKNQIGQMVYGPGVARKAADVVAEMKVKEEAEKQKQQQQQAAAGAK